MKVGSSCLNSFITCMHSQDASNGSLSMVLCAVVLLATSAEFCWSGLCLRHPCSGGPEVVRDLFKQHFSSLDDDRAVQPLQREHRQSLSAM